MNINNQVILIGNLGRDPELKISKKGNPTVRFSLATDDSYLDADGNKVERTDWHTIYAYGKQAERIDATLRKGAQIAVYGKLKHYKDTDGNGTERYFTYVSLYRYRPLGSRPTENVPFPTEEPVSSRSTNSTPDLSDIPPVGDADDDLPF